MSEHPLADIFRNGEESYQFPLLFVGTSLRCPEGIGLFILTRNGEMTIGVYRKDENGAFWETEKEEKLSPDMVLAWSAIPCKWRGLSGSSMERFLPNQDRDAYERYKKSCGIEDIQSILNEEEFSKEERTIVSGISMDTLYERFIKALDNNDYYWDCYWLTLKDVLREEIRAEKAKQEERGKTYAQQNFSN